MADKSPPAKKPRAIGQCVASGNWEDYWRTSISEAGEGTINVRGYSINEVIEHLSYVEMTYLLIRGTLPTDQQAAGPDLVLRSGADQQFINSAISPARFVASAAPEAPVSAIASGILAFGSVTGSPQDCAAMILAVEGLMRQEELSREDAVNRIIDRYREQGMAIPGLGHPMHKKEEPRVTSLRKVAEELGLWGEKAAMLEALQEQFARRHRLLPMNLAGAIACLLTELEFDPLEMSGLAAMIYLPALIAHTVEEIKEGVPLRVIPDALGAAYTGPGQRPPPARYKRRKADRTPA